MLSKANYEKVKGVDGLNIISALSHREIVELLSWKVIQPELFDERVMVRERTVGGL